MKKEGTGNKTDSFNLNKSLSWKRQEYYLNRYKAFSGMF